MKVFVALLLCLSSIVHAEDKKISGIRGIASYIDSDPCKAIKNMDACRSNEKCEYFPAIAQVRPGICLSKEGLHCRDLNADSCKGRFKKVCEFFPAIADVRPDVCVER
ncbi:MAG TPA: hypothetical protein VN132_13675 [Bdellovibrio sp.]|nr:hypothetical protein [Bdellovibrio sp.]